MRRASATPPAPHGACLQPARSRPTSPRLLGCASLGAQEPSCARAHPRTRANAPDRRRSARTDEPLNGKYVQHVLTQPQQKAKPAASATRQSCSVGTVGGTEGVDPAASDAARASHSLLPFAAHANGRPAQGASQGAGECADDGAPQPFGATRKGAFEWNPMASLADNMPEADYEDLLGPVDVEPPPRPSAGDGGGGGGSSGGGGGGGSLLHGTFDEDESAASFAEALRAFRGAGKSDAPQAGGASVPAARPSRFGAKSVVAAKPTEPTLADRVHAIKVELGIAAETPMGEAIAIANSAVGLGPHGSLSDQVGRLLRETGIQPTAGAAPAVSAAPYRASAGTATEGGDGGNAGAGASPRLRPASAGMHTQTQPPKSFYERLLEQKRKDGLA